MISENQRNNINFCQYLQQECEKLKSQELWRILRRVESEQSSRIIVEGKLYINFSSNDYLGLASHPALKEAAIKAVEKYGAGSGASRLICGSMAIHHKLEERLADFKQTEAALSFSSGYLTAIGTICSLVGKGDIVILDRLAHSCLIDATRLSGAKLMVFHHNDCEHLESILKRINNGRSANQKALIVTETVFSMDGDIAPLKQIVELKEKYGAWLMVDEAHATGIYKSGIVNSLGIGEAVELQMGTLGKAVGASGGFICGKKVLIEYLINKARSFIFTTAPPPAASAAALEGINIIDSDEGKMRAGMLLSLIDELKMSLLSADIDVSNIQSAIFPVILGSNEKATKVAKYLMENGIYIPAIRYPTVPKNSARLRITLTANHNPEDVRLLTLALKSISGI
ncbi:MAG TPA: 8-amino-7-oxononanoate synthase [Verrucomicrobiota bacterium]|nr:8-amino-7-oxononanoate synthase [Verrucomicrobiota bacterium]